MPKRILRSSATAIDGLEADGHVVGHVVATQRQDGGVEGRAIEEEGHVRGAGADVGDGHAEVTLGLGEDGLGRREWRGDQLVDADACLLDALGQVLDDRRAGVDDVRLDLEADGAHAHGVLDALLAVDRRTRAAGRGGPRDCDGMLTARATSVARSTSSRVTSLRGPLTATAPREFWLSTWSPPTLTKADSSL